MDDQGIEKKDLLPLFVKADKIGTLFNQLFRGIGLQQDFLVTEEDDCLQEPTPPKRARSPFF